MVKPTWHHYFYARNWPGRIWFIVCPLLPVLYVAIAIDAPPDLLAFGRDAGEYLVLLGLFWALGYLVSGLVGWFVLGPLYHWRAELNGYPFQPGDRVVLLVGRNRGWLATVKEVTDWRGVLEVDLTGAPRPRAGRYFAFVEVLRADPAGLPTAAGTTLT